MVDFTCRLIVSAVLTFRAFEDDVACELLVHRRPPSALAAAYSRTLSATTMMAVKTRFDGIIMYFFFLMDLHY